MKIMTAPISKDDFRHTKCMCFMGIDDRVVSSEKSCLCSDVVGGGSGGTHVVVVGPLVLGPGLEALMS